MTFRACLACRWHPVFVQARIDLVLQGRCPRIESIHSLLAGVSSWEPHSLHLVLYRIMSCWPIGRTVYFTLNGKQCIDQLDEEWKNKRITTTTITTTKRNRERERETQISTCNLMKLICPILLYYLQVSLMSRIIPSPDWFIGIDNFDLCVNGNWLDSITIEVSSLSFGSLKEWIIIARILLL